jgi:toxin-antitoxin system PIN domain toxin
MLYLPDINILIYAKMTGMPEHKAALEWLSRTLGDPNSTLLLCETTVLSFLRITTNPKVFSPPLSYSAAVLFVENLSERTNVLVFQPTIGHFNEVAEFMKKHNFGGNLVMDAHLAIVAVKTGAMLVTRDADFDKIPYLKTINPIGPYSDE